MQAVPIVVGAIAAGAAAVKAAKKLRQNQKDGKAEVMGEEVQPSSDTAQATQGQPSPMPSSNALHGSTLQALLKMRCDLIGGQYAIFWNRENGKLVVEGDYATDEFRQQFPDNTYAHESETFIHSVSDTFCVSLCYSSGNPVFEPDVANSNLERREVALKYGIQQICLIPFEGGILECGSTGKPWDSMPSCPDLPVAAVRRAFERICAAYCLYWVKDGDEFKAVSDYVPEARKASIQRMLGEDTFSTRSKEYVLQANGQGPVATCFRKGVEEELDESGANNMKRVALVREYAIQRLYFVPTASGVVEFGVPFNIQVSSETLEASLKMQCELSGAGYALYWTLAKPSGYEPWVEKAVVAGSYVSEAREAVLRAEGRTSSCVEESKAYVLDASTPSPTFAALQTKKPLYLQEAVECEVFERRELFRTYNIGSVAFEPMPGGVLEFGTTKGPCTSDWGSIDDARGALVPFDVLEEAFTAGATHTIFWRQVGDELVPSASYIIPERARMLQQARGDTKSYTLESLSMRIRIGSGSPVAKAAQSGSAIHVDNPASAPGCERAKLAKEFHVISSDFVPCQGGVLEYGTARQE